MIFAIDPGLDGAIAVLHSDGVVNVYDMPTFKTGKGSRRVYDLYVMWSAIARRSPIELIVLEQQQPMKGQGITSTYSTGRGMGIWEGLITASGLPYRIVRPQQWQKEIGVAPKSGKAGVAEVVLRAFPHAEIRGPKGGLKDGRSDAIGLAMWGRQQNGGGK